MKKLSAVMFLFSLSLSTQAQQKLGEAKQPNPGAAISGGYGMGSQAVWTCQLSQCKNLKNPEQHTYMNAITPTKDQALGDKICKEKLDNLDDPSLNQLGAYGQFGMMGVLSPGGSKTEDKIWMDQIMESSKNYYKTCALTGKLMPNYVGKSITTFKGLELPMRACGLSCKTSNGGVSEMALFAIAENDSEAIELCKEKISLLQSGKISAKQLRKQGELVMAVGIGMGVGGPGAFTKSETRFLKKKLKHLYDGCTVKAVPGQMGMNMGEMKF